jgi:hypothetical protein
MVRRIPTSAESNWSRRVNVEHLAPAVIRGFIRHGSEAPGAERTREHIEQCEECQWVFLALRSNEGADVVIDYVYETREALRQMWAVAEKQAANVREELSAIERRQWLTLLAVVLLIMLKVVAGSTPLSRQANALGGHRRDSPPSLGLRR